jgi:hypothetical protein
MTVVFLLALAAFVAAIASAIGKAPLWVSVVLLCVIALLQSIPLR